MKKTYIKPFMESEEFVTNEYVAACWLVTCLTDPDRENFITHIDPNPLHYGNKTTGYTDGVHPSGYFYNNKGDGKFTHNGHEYVPSYDLLGNWANGQHEVNYDEVEQAGTLTSGEKYGPNAS